MQLSKGQAWHRYAVMRLEGVFSRFYTPQEVRGRLLGLNEMIAALVNAAVPEATTTPVTLKRVSEIRTRLSARSAILQDR